MLQRLGDWSDVCALGLPCQKGQARKLIKNVGIDIGSTTVKVVVMEGDRVLYRVYQRHLSQVRQATLRALEGAKQFLDGPFQVAISGSAGLGLAEDAGVDFVQEVFATYKTVMEYEPDTDAVIELGGEDAKIIFLSGGLEERMNGSCAGGTGAFIDQMATLMNVSIDELDRLSNREQEVMRLIARGYTYKEVASELFISIKTVETHMSSVLRKLQLSNRSELTRWAADRRIV